MSKSIIIYLLGVSFLALCASVVADDDGHDLSPKAAVLSVGSNSASYSPATGPSNSGVAANAVNLYTGQFIESFPLVSLAGRGGMGVSLSLDYNGNVFRQAKMENHFAQASPYGLGFDLGLQSIICDHKNTADVDDDEYWLLSGGQRSALHRDGVYYRIETGEPWVITRCIDTIDSQPVVTGWTIIKEDGAICRFGDFNHTTLHGLNATRNVLRYGQYVGNGVTNDDEIYPIQWDLKVVHDPDSINWVEFSYLKDDAYLEVMTVNDTTLVNSGHPYTRASYLNHVLTSDGNSIHLSYGSRDDYYEFYGVNIYEFLYTKILNTVQVYNRSNELQSTIRFIYSYLNQSSQYFSKLVLDEIYYAAPDSATMPPTSFEYFATTTDFRYGGMQSIMYPSGAVKEITYKTVDSTANFTDLDWQFRDSLMGGNDYADPPDDHNTEVYLADNMMLARGTPIKVGYWDGYWHYDTVSILYNRVDRAAVSPDGWAAIWDHQSEKIIVKRWMNGYWRTDSLSGCDDNQDVLLFPGKDCFLAVTTYSGNENCPWERPLPNADGFTRAYYYRWDGHSWGDTLVYYKSNSGWTNRWNIGLAGEYFYIATWVSSDIACEQSDLCVLVIGKYDPVQSHVCIQYVDTMSTGSNFTKTAYGPGYYAFLGNQGINLYRYTGISWEHTTYHPDAYWRADAICPLSNGVASTFGFDTFYSYLEGIFLASSGWKRVVYEFGDGSAVASRLYGSNHSVAIQFTTGNIGLLDWAGNLWSSLIPNPCNSCGAESTDDFYLFPNYFHLPVKGWVRHYEGKGVWQDSNTTGILGVPSISNYTIRRHHAHGEDGDTIGIAIYNRFYGWINTYRDFPIKVLICNTNWHDCDRYGEVHASGNSFYHFEKYFTYEDTCTTGFPWGEGCHDLRDHWADGSVYRLVDTLFSGKAQLVVVDSILTYKYEDDPNPIAQTYTFFGGLLDQSGITPRCAKATVSTPHFVSDPIDGYTATYFYNDMDSTTFYDQSIHDSMWIPPLTCLNSERYGTANGGFALDGQVYLTYSYSAIDTLDENRDSTIYYHSLYCPYTSDSTIHRIRLDSVYTRQDGMVNKTIYDYDTCNAQIMETKTLFKDDDTLTACVSYAYQNIDDTAMANAMRADNAIVQPADQFRYLKTDTGLVLLDSACQRYEKHGAWQPAIKYTWRDLDNTSDTIFTYRAAGFDDFGNAYGAVNVSGDTSWIKFDDDGIEAIATGANCSYEDFLIQDFEQSSTWDGWGWMTPSQQGWFDTNSFTGEYAYKIIEDADGEHNWGPWRRILGEDMSSDKYYYSCWVKGNEDILIYAWINGVQGRYKFFEGDSLSTSVWKQIDGLFDFSDIPPESLTYINVQLVMLDGGTDTSKFVMFDNFRFHPIDAHVSTTVYDRSTDVVSAELGLNNIPTFHEYDSFHRPTYTRNYNGNVLSRRDYFNHYTVSYWQSESVHADSEGRDYDSTEVTISAATDSAKYTSNIRAFGGGTFDDTVRTTIRKNGQLVWQQVCVYGDTIGYYRHSAYYSVGVGDVIQVIAEYQASNDGYSSMTLNYPSNTAIEQETEIATNPNVMRAVSFTSTSGALDSAISISFYDNYGRLLQTRTTNYVIGATPAALVSGITEYDARGRVVKSYKPYYDLVSPAGVCDFSDMASVIQEVNAYYDGTNDADCDGVPYSENVYENGIKGRLKESAGPGESWKIGSGHTTRYSYHTGNDVFVNATLDPDNVKSVALSDRWGLLSQDTAYYLDAQGDSAFIVTTTHKNIKGGVDSVYTGDGTNSAKIRSYKYDDAGRTTEEWRVDYGTIRMLYDKAGNLRFMQNDKRLAESTFVYFKYDIFGRKIEEGLFHDTTASPWYFMQTYADDPDFPGSSFIGGRKTPTYLWTHDYRMDGATLEDVSYGNLEMVENYGASYYRKYFHFPFENRDSVDVKLLSDLTHNKWLVHTYDELSGQITKFSVYPNENHAGSQAFKYVYDRSGRLSSVREDSIVGTPSYPRDYAVYSYLASGSLSQLRLGRSYLGSPIAQFVNYAYNPMGMLTRINDTSSVVSSINGYGSANPHFGLTITYGSPNGYFNGRPDSLATANSSSGGKLTHRYSYTYNDLSWLTAAMHGAPQDSWNRRFWYNYLGNRDSVRIGTPVDPVTTYMYSGAVGSSKLLGFNGDTTSRTYDVLGNLTSETGIHQMAYDYRNLMTNAWLNQTYPGAQYNGMDYSYDENGMRIRYRTSYRWREWVGPGGGIESIGGDSLSGEDDMDSPLEGAGTDGSGGGGGGEWQYHINTSQKHYLYDNGVLIATFDARDSVLQMYVNGGDGQAVAVFDHNDPNNKRYYLLRDQVGSVRMAVKDNGQVMEYVNYHPFGEIAQSWASYDEPMKFTGHERDTFETMGYTYFGARYYDPELGQFTSIDKAGQFAGGFNYCGNNPIIGVDKDGNLFFVPFLVGAAYGALFSTAAYTASSGIAALTGDYVWTWDNFGKGLGKAALSGAIGGGLSASLSMIGGQLANQFSYNMLSSSVSQSATSAIMGEKVTISGVIGGAAGNLAAGTMIGNYSPVSRNGWLNMAAEFAHSAASGAVSRFLGSSFAYALNSNNAFPDLGRELRMGAIGGLGNAMAKNAIMGQPIRPPERLAGDLSDSREVFGVNSDPCYRSGGLTGLFVHGLALGRDVVVTQPGGGHTQAYRDYLWFHESAHYWQQQNARGGGWANMVGRSAGEQIKSFFTGQNLYTTWGTSECNANIVSCLCGYPYPYPY